MKLFIGTVGVFLIWLACAFWGMKISDWTWHNGIPHEWESRYVVVADSTYYLGNYIYINDSVKIIAKPNKYGDDKVYVMLNDVETKAWTYPSISDNLDETVWFLGAKYDEYLIEKKPFNFE